MTASIAGWNALQDFRQHLKIAVALASLGLLLWLVDWRSSLTLLAQIALGPLAVACTTSVLGVLVSAWKWQQLLRARGLSAPFWNLTRLYWIGAFVSSFLPSNIGGDVARTVLSRRIGDLGPISASIIVERLTGIGVLLLVALGAVLARPDILAYRPLWTVIMTAIAVGAAAVLAIFVVLFLRGGGLVGATDEQPGPPASSRGWISRLRQGLRRAETALAAYARDPGALLVASAASVLFYALLILFQYAVIRAFGFEIGFGDVVAITPLVALISALPISLGGIGISEGAFVFFYTQVGLTPEQALAAAVLRRLLMTGTALVGGVLWLTMRERGFKTAAGHGGTTEPT